MNILGVLVNGIQNIPLSQIELAIEEMGLLKTDFYAVANQDNTASLLYRGEEFGDASELQLEILRAYVTKLVNDDIELKKG